MGEEQERKNEPLTSVSTDVLIAELEGRKLEPKQIIALTGVVNNQKNGGNIGSEKVAKEVVTPEWLVSSIRKRSIWGKLPRGLAVGGKELNWKPDYNYHGPDMLTETPESRRVDFLMAVIRNNKSKVLRGVNDHFVSIYPAAKEDGGVL